jgi:hypothetical protein
VLLQMQLFCIVQNHGKCFMASLKKREEDLSVAGRIILK